MNSTPSNNQYPIVPPEELRCVWMSAGVLSYQLCDREFDCDNCAVDKAIKKQHPRVQEHKAGYVAGSPILMDGFLYTKNHCWIKPLDDQTVHVGIEPGLASMFFLPKAVILPSIGALLRSNETCSWIVLEGGALPFPSPLDGTVLEINRRVVDNPVLLSHQKEDECWLFKMRVEASTLKRGGFWDKAKAAHQYALDLEDIKELLARASRTARTDAGITLADGGELLQTVMDKIGHRHYFTVLLTYLAKKNH